MTGLAAEITVTPLPEKDVKEAARICRVAFGTFLGSPDPERFFGDREMVVNRWRANREAVLGAYDDGELVGSNVVSRWGTFGWFGPLTVRPDHWDRGVARALLEPTMGLFSKWKTTGEGLFTFPDSPKHLGLYGKYGFSARMLTPIASKEVGGAKGADAFMTLTRLGAKERAEAIGGLRELTEAIYPGLDLTDEAAAVGELGLGDVVVPAGRSTEGFAVCHAGPNTEAGTGTCYVKFAAARPGPSARRNFREVLRAIEGYARERELKTIEAGVNMARKGAYEELMAAGFKSEFSGVAMQRPEGPGFNRPDVFVLDDWR